jgi:hypothetical protein
VVNAASRVEGEFAPDKPAARYLPQLARLRQGEYVVQYTTAIYVTLTPTERFQPEIDSVRTRRGHPIDLEDERKLSSKFLDFLYEISEIIKGPASVGFLPCAPDQSPERHKDLCHRMSA